MGKTFRFDPDSFDGRSNSNRNRKRNRDDRRNRRRKDRALDSQMRPDNSEEGDPILNEVMRGKWDEF